MAESKKFVPGKGMVPVGKTKTTSPKDVIPPKKNAKKEVLPTKNNNKKSVPPKKK